LKYYRRIIQCCKVICNNLEQYEELGEKYKTLLQQYVDYQEDASYKIEKLEKKTSQSNTVSKFNIKTMSPEKKKDVRKERSEKLMITEMDPNDEEAYNKDFINE
jgi:hypothetical protein